MDAAEARPSLHMSKCHIVGNLIITFNLIILRHIHRCLCINGMLSARLYINFFSSSDWVHIAIIQLLRFHKIYQIYKRIFLTGTYLVGLWILFLICFQTLNFDIFITVASFRGNRQSLPCMFVFNTHLFWFGGNYFRLRTHQKSNYILISYFTFMFLLI